VNLGFFRFRSVEWKRGDGEGGAARDCCCWTVSTLCMFLIVRVADTVAYVHATHRQYIRERVDVDGEIQSW
jgi:hypothetical protein